MEELKKDTEEKILEAAKKVFIRKGMDGTRMQEIADEAGINKSLLHYYFRSKNKLFEEVFKGSIGAFFPKVANMMLAESISLSDKIKFFVNEYIDMLSENPFLPSFILSELNRDPDALLQLFNDHVNHSDYKDMHTFSQKLMGNNPQDFGFADVRHLIVNMLGLCVFPFMAKPLLIGVLFNEDEKAFQKFLDERKEVVVNFILNSIQK